jgi:hypothetical protein
MTLRNNITITRYINLKRQEDFTSILLSPVSCGRRSILKYFVTIENKTRAGIIHCRFPTVQRQSVVAAAALYTIADHRCALVSLGKGQGSVLVHNPLSVRPRGM